MYTQFLSLSEGAGNTAASAMTEAINAGVTSAVGLVGTAFTAITSNAVLCIFLGAALVRVGMGIFRSMKSSVR